MTALARRLAAASAVELARLNLLHSNRFIREELLYPTMALAVSAEKWQPSVEVPLTKRRKSGGGDVSRADLKFWRRDCGTGKQLEVLVEVKLFRKGIPTTTKGLGSCLRRIRERYDEVAKADARVDRRRILLVVLVSSRAGEGATANSRAGAVPIPDASVPKPTPAFLASASVDSVYPATALVYRVPIP